MVKISFPVAPSNGQTFCWSTIQAKPKTIYHRNHLLANFFRTTYSDWLFKPWIRFIILILFVVYFVSFNEFILKHFNLV